MEWFPGPLSRAESDAFIDRAAEQISAHDWGLWAVESHDTDTPELDGFIGMVGIWRPAIGPWLAARTPWLDEPVIEVGWRLIPAAWGHGYATEAASAALDIAASLRLADRVVSFTVTGNRRSRRVMDRLGMTHDPADDFAHPTLPDGDPLQPHVLYRIDITARSGPS